MHNVLGPVACLTRSRDRDEVDAMAVTLITQWLQPLAASLYRCVGEPGSTRLLLLASARRGHPTQAGDPGWTELDALPGIAERPDHLQAFSNGEPVLDRPCPELAGIGSPLLHSIFPIWVGPQRACLLEVLNERPLDEAQRQLISGVLAIYCNQVGLLDYSERDTLTGLLNRKTFDERIGKCLLEMAGAASRPDGQSSDRVGERRGAPVAQKHWLGVIDIDHFKRVNDGFGHLIGDEVLLLVGRLLRTAFRHGDQLFRFGGEEFVVLLRADQRAHAALAFQRFREMMAAYRFPQVGCVTASIGFTEVHGLDTHNAAFERADRAIYHAKQNGRNRVECHEELIAAGLLEASEKIGAIELF